MMKNMKQLEKMLTAVNKDMNAAELTKVMEKFEQVRMNFSRRERETNDLLFVHRHSKISM